MWSNDPKCDTCRGTLAGHVQCCRAHVYSDHAAGCAARHGREAVAALHTSRPGDCGLCGRSWTEVYACDNCDSRHELRGVFAWAMAIDGLGAHVHITPHDIRFPHRGDCTYGARRVTGPDADYEF